MKKLAFLLLVALLLPLVACADSLMSITDLRAQVEASGGRWTQTYTTSKGETISVDVPIEVPNVETFPVVNATWMQRMPDQFRSEYGGTNMQTVVPYSFANIERYGHIVSFHNYEHIVGDGDRKGNRHFSYVGENLIHNDRALSEIYAFNNGLSAEDAFVFMMQTVRECYERYDMPFYEPYLNYISLNDLLCDGISLRGTGELFFDCFETIQGVPILSTAGQGCNRMRPYYRFYISSKDSYEFNCQPYVATEIVVEDVPLLSFSDIKPVYEDLITKGNLKDVYFLRLGYVSVYEGGKNENEVFRLIPCWALTGEYYTSAKDEESWKKQEESGALDDTAIMDRGSSKSILINAQTGKIIDTEASNSELRKLFNVKTR